MRLEIAMGALWNAKSIKLSSPIVPFYGEGDEHSGCVNRISHYLSTHRLFWQSRTNRHKRQFICSVTELLPLPSFSQPVQWIPHVFQQEGAAFQIHDELRYSFSLSQQSAIR